MREIPKEQTGSVSSSRPHAQEGELPTLRVLLENGMPNGRRRWRLSAGFAFQTVLLGLVLVTPLLFTEPVDSKPPIEHVVVVYEPRSTGGVKDPHPTGGEVRPPQLASKPPEVYFKPSEIRPIEPTTMPVWGESPDSEGTAISLPHLGPGQTKGAGTGVGSEGSGPRTGPSVPGALVISKGVQGPRLLQQVKPVYPLVARQARVEGDVVLQALIGVDGRIQQIEVKKGHGALVAAAVGAVSQWVYEPTLLNDRPVPVLLEVTVQFRLRQ
jgi:protein TonB